MDGPVITTLDVLKKGTHALNVAARNATRFLEERLGGPGAQYGLVPQAAAATAGPPMSLAEADAMRMACDSSTITLDAEAAAALPSKHVGWATDGGEQDLSLRRANAAHRAVLLLALSLPDHVLAVASPPATLASTTTTTPLAKVAHSHGDGGGGGGVGSGVLSEERPRWCERVDGARATRLAQAHGVQTLSCPTARSWLELDAHSPASSSASLPPPPSKTQPPAQPCRAGAEVAAPAAAAPDERLGRAATPVAARDRAAAPTPEPASSADAAAEAQAASRPRIIFAE